MGSGWLIGEDQTLLRRCPQLIIGFRIVAVFTRDGELLARGQMTAVCCRAAEGGAMESVEIPAEIRAKLEAPV